jgi:O-succinylbenzoic acid--CoA ligase
VILLPGAPLPVTDLLRLAERALAGDGVVLTTSGSTGRPKRVALSAAALHASAEGTAERIGGLGQWLLTLPADHIAGWQVAVRSALAGTVPVRLEGRFTPSRFRAVVAAMGKGPRFVSLVPTQLVRLVEDAPALAALATFDGVLVGGAALPTPLLERATAAGVRIHRTYGMTETAGGCVYDGNALTGVRVRLEGSRVLLGGPVVADGYVGDEARTRDRFGTDGRGRRWFRTDDVGELDAEGHLRVLGRVDDVVNTGGFKVAPHAVEEALLQLPGVREAVVFGVADAEWGQRVAAALVGASGAVGAAEPPVEQVRDALRAALPAYALPRQVLWVDRLPLLASGKPDRALLRDRCAATSGTMDPRRRSAD